MIYEILPNRSAAVFMRKDRKLRLFLFMTSSHHDALGTKPHSPFSNEARGRRYKATATLFWLIQALQLHAGCIAYYN